jgi:hypothetical protein
MRYAVVIALAAGVALLGGIAIGAPDGTRKATLKMTSGTPVTIRGARFVPGERVRISVSDARTRTRRVTANTAGVFVAEFPIAFDRCNGLIVSAVGSEGSRATLKRPELLCPPRL